MPVLDRPTPGDPDFLDPALTGTPSCQAESPEPYICTRSANHPGDHAAHATFPVGVIQVGTWSQDPPPVHGSVVIRFAPGERPTGKAWCGHCSTWVVREGASMPAEVDRALDRHIDAEHVTVQR